MRKCLFALVMQQVLITAAQGAGEITDAATLAAFAEAVVNRGFSCPRILLASKLEYATELGQPFMVACAGGGSGFYYRVTVQQRGTVLVEPWR